MGFHRDFSRVFTSLSVGTWVGCGGARSENPTFSVSQIINPKLVSAVPHQRGAGKTESASPFQQKKGDCHLENL